LSPLPEEPAQDSAAGEHSHAAEPGAAANEQARESDTARAGAGLEAELRNWQALLQQALEAGNAFSRLVLLELRLAVGDAGRLALVVLALVPLVIFTWLGLSVLLAWWAFAALESVALGLVAFTALQVAALLLLWLAARRYARSLALPATRRQLRAIMETGNGSKPQAENP
tara:strand:+ start:84395 stop:84907 length:513 start_codon:yes stop_codon:yes gene_type:complete